LFLLYAKNIEGDRWSGLVNNELFPEQLRKLVEASAIRKATKPLQRCACELFKASFSQILAKNED